MQWYGGLGIVVLWAALSMRTSRATKALMGISHEEDLVGGTIARSRRALGVYCLLTGIGFTALAICGVPVFAATLHALASVSTGGFSSFDNSLQGLPNSFAAAAVIVCCLAGAIPTMNYYHAWQRRPAMLLFDRQVWSLLALAAIGTGVLIPLISNTETTWGTGSIGNAVTMAMSAQTTAGFSTVDVGTLPPPAKAVLIVLMAIGGGAGSTAGGLKLLRLMILLRFVQAMFFRMSLPPHAVSSPRLAGHRLGSEELHEATMYLTMGLFVVGLSWFAFLLMGYDPLDSLFEVVSATGTVGLSTGISGPQLPLLLKGVLCVDMFMGRLEIVAIILLISPRTWIGQRRHEP
jgi:trk system potassium uptake protein TrkH